jgi:hypothetical protein
MNHIAMHMEARNSIKLKPVEDHIAKYMEASYKPVKKCQTISLKAYGGK